MVLVFGAIFMSFVSCSSDNNEPDAPTYIPKESSLSSLVRIREPYSVTYTRRWDKGYLSIYSNAIVDGKKTDYYGISLIITDVPYDDKLNGRYMVEQLDAKIWGFKNNGMTEYVKNELSTSNNTQPVKGAWVQIDYLGQTDEYDRRIYRLTFHADEMTEKNGDYAKDLNVSYTGYFDGGMLTY